MPNPSKALILLVEDNADLCDTITQHLEIAELMVQSFDRGSKALEFLQKNFVNLVLLDINLPDYNGFDLIREIRAREAPPPVIFITGQTSELSKVQGLESGADDYITKPFSYAELIARIKAVLRRTETAYDQQLTPNTRFDENPFTFCGARIDPGRLEIRFPNGVCDPIGRKELGILSYLNSNPDHVVSRKAMIHAVWGEHADVRSRSLDQYVVKIRDRFKKNDCSIDAFRTLHGIGYIYDQNPAGEGAEAS